MQHQLKIVHYVLLALSSLNPKLARPFYRNSNLFSCYFFVQPNFTILHVISGKYNLNFLNYINSSWLFYIRCKRKGWPLKRIGTIQVESRREYRLRRTETRKAAPKLLIASSYALPVFQLPMFLLTLVHFGYDVNE